MNLFSTQTVRQGSTAGFQSSRDPPSESRRFCCSGFGRRIYISRYRVGSDG